MSDFHSKEGDFQPSGATEHASDSVKGREPVTVSRCGPERYLKVHECEMEQQGSTCAL